MQGHSLINTRRLGGWTGKAKRQRYLQKERMNADEQSRHCTFIIERHRLEIYQL